MPQQGAFPTDMPHNSDWGCPSRAVRPAAILPQKKSGLNVKRTERKAFLHKHAAESWLPDVRQGQDKDLRRRLQVKGFFSAATPLLSSRLALWLLRGYKNVV